VDALGRVLAINPGQTDAVRALIGALGDTSDAVRVGAALALAKEGVRAEGAIPGLAVVARDTAHPRARRIALETLGRLTHSLPTREATRVAPQIASALAVGLSDPDRSVRMTALTALGGMRRAAASAAPGVAPRLIGLTGDVDPDVRLSALNALAALPSPSTLVVSNATHALTDSAARVRVGAADVLRALGDSASGATPALVGALRDRDPDVRRAAAVSLGYVMSPGDAATTSALRQARGDPDAAVRLEAEHALTQFHRHGGQDPAPPPLPEPSRDALCRKAPAGTVGC
jgi:HEAT repeat protein